MRNRFDRELEALNTELIQMGALIEEAISIAVEALIKKDKVLAHKAIEFDTEIDEQERMIERHCLHLLLQQQPVAKDLRLISTALKMITDMERIGDHAGDISEITLNIADQEYIKKLEHIPMMADVTISMVKESIDAFVSKDTDRAWRVIARDDRVDELFCIIKSDLIELVYEDKAKGEQAMDLLMVAKYFERIGDHAENISEWVIFSITGEHKNERIM